MVNPPCRRDRLEQSAARPGFPAERACTPGAAGAARPFDSITAAILGGFSLLSLLAIALMWNGWQLARHSVAVQRLFAKQDYAAAIPRLQALMRLEPANMAHAPSLATAYLETNQPDSALQIYQSLLETRKDLDLNEALGRCYAEKGEWDTAREYFQKVLQKDGNHPAANFYLGVDHLQRGEYAQAGRCFQIAGADPKWDKRAIPYREQLAQKALAEPPAASTASSAQ